LTVTRNPPDVAAACGWRADLRLRFFRRDAKTLCDPWHEGPLRVLKALYPEGDEVCHAVIVHPPGGIVAGDQLQLAVDVEPGAHALVTTPGATRFYRSQGAIASQALSAVVRETARLEWVPQETIVHDAALSSNRLVFKLERGASMIGWDIVCLGLPAAGECFQTGRLDQHLEVGEGWLERARIDAIDQRLLQSPLGLAGRPVMATAWVAWGEPMVEDAERVDSLKLLEAARAMVDTQSSSSGDAGGSKGAAWGPGESLVAAATHVQPRVIVVRALAFRVEPVWALLRDVRKAWRSALWQRPAVDPRVWP
jgi:urease accessory protein